MLRSIVIATAGVIFWSSAAAAQACLGVPTRDGGFNVRAELALPEDSRQYSAVVTADLIGPFSFELNAGLIDIDEIDDRGTSFGGRLAYELQGMRRLSICPFGGAQYSALTASQPVGPLTLEAEASSLVIPIGVGLGTRLPLGASSMLTVFAQPQYLHVRTSFEESDGVADLEEEHIGNEAGIEAGLRLSFGRLLAGGAMNWTTIDGADPVFSVTFGATFGSR